ncbi:MAG: HYR domain-containing protein, partial [Acidobacteria bacterium]|nr:HYR domain-containing protein [Acidobacteriota bacterium]
KHTIKFGVKDVNRPPAISVGQMPGSFEAVTGAGRQVLLAGTASDPDGDELTLQWFNGSSLIATTAEAQVLLGLGTHTLFLRATDSKGLSADSRSLQVSIVDTTPPVISNVPGNLSAKAVDRNGATVTFTAPTSIDLVDGAVPVLLDRPSGSLFPIGTTIVTAAAVDSSGNRSTATFTVRVTPPDGGPSDFTISPYAGNGTSGSAGNGGSATQASFRQVVALSLDSNKNLILADLLSRNFRRVDRTTGLVSILAGNGGSGNSGDGGSALFATFGQPGGIAADTRGNIYVADTLHHRVRRISSDGKIYHFAGSATGAAGSIGDNGLATAARLRGPTAIAVDSAGNIYIADSGNNRVRVVNATTGNISNFAGSGGGGFGGDGGPAVQASFNGLAGINFDRAGNLYIADRLNHRIRRVDSSTGIVSTVTGNGVAGFSGDGGLSSQAQLDGPADVVVDASGNLVIADQNNHRIRLSSSLGFISSIAGDGTSGFTGDGGLATLAKLNQPRAMVLMPDASFLVADSGNFRIRRLASNSPVIVNRAPVITSVISDQTIKVGQTVELALSATDADDDSVTFTLQNAPSYITVANPNPAQRTATVRLAPVAAGSATGIIIRAEDSRGGVTTSGPFNVVVNSAVSTNRAPEVDPGTIPPVLEAIAANGAPLVLSGSGTDPDGDPLTFVWTINGISVGNSALASITLPIGVHRIVLTATDSRGATTSSLQATVEVRDTTPPHISGLPNNIAATATTQTGVIVEYQMPKATDLVDGVVSVTADRASGTLFPVGTTRVNFTAVDTRGNVAAANFNVTVSLTEPSTAGYAITTYAGTGETGSAGNQGPARLATFRQLVAAGFDSDGNYIVVDQLSRNIRRILKSTGIISILAGNGVAGNTGDGGPATFATFGQPGGVVSDSKGNIYVSDMLHHRVRRIAKDGRIYHFAGSATGTSGSMGDNGPAIAARLNGPSSLAVDNQDNLYIADTNNSRIRVVSSSTGIITTFAGTGGGGFAGDGGPANRATLNGPIGITFDAEGSLYVADARNHRIRRIDGQTKIIATVAGNGTAGYSGDSSAATSAQLNQPNDVTVDSNRNIVIADMGNHRLRLIDTAGRISTIAGDGTAAFSGDGGNAGQARLSGPRAVDIVPGSTVLLVTDTGNMRVRQLLTGSTTFANNPPMITSVIEDRTITSGEKVDLVLTATDQEEDAVSFSLINAPPFATIVDSDDIKRTAILRLTPTATGVVPDMQVQASDNRGGVTSSTPFTLTIVEPPSAATITSISSSSGRRGTAVNAFVTGEGFDQDATVTFSGTGVLAITAFVNPTRLNVRIIVLSNATPSVRDLLLKNGNGTEVIRKNAFTVVR